MSDYGISIKLNTDIDTARARVTAALAEQGFGVLTEIDIAATLKKKLGKDVPPQVILGACNPVLADRALQAETSIGLLLPCNVVPRSVGETRTVVEALDPGVMVTFTGNPALEPVATEARTKLTAALGALTAGTVGAWFLPPDVRPHRSDRSRRGGHALCLGFVTRRR